MTIKPQDIFGAASPETVLNKPHLEAQCRLASSASHPGYPIGNTNVDLNTLAVNEIPGASLYDDRISLPAGTYYFEGEAVVRYFENIRTILSVRVNYVNVLSGGQTRVTGDDIGYLTATVSGQFTLTSTSEVILSMYSTVATSLITGLSQPPYGYWGGLKIWQLDASTKTPVLVNDKLYPMPGNTFVTGNYHGLDYNYKSTNLVTVQPGICMDSTNQTLLSLSSEQDVTIGTGANTIYSLFLCEDGLIHTDDNANGDNIAAYGARRWIGFTANNGSGVLYSTFLKGDMLYFNSPQVVASGLAHAVITDVDASALCEPSRVASTQWNLSCYGTSASARLYNIGSTTPIAYASSSYADSSTYTDAAIGDAIGYTARAALYYSTSDSVRVNGFRLYK